MQRANPKAPISKYLPRWKTAIVIIAGLGVAFPLVGISLVVIWVMDWLVLSRAAKAQPTT